MATIATVESTCAHCGVAMCLRPVDIKRGKKYCSRDCYKAAAWDGAWLPARTCKTCGEEYQVRKSDADKNKEYCSRACRVADRPELECENCHQRYRVYPSLAKRGGRNYCSIGCRDADKAAVVAVRCCKACGSKFEVAKSQDDFNSRHGITLQAHCSVRCAGKSMRDINISRTYKGGKRSDLPHIVRSSWEANFARFLTYMHKDYEYEPRAFDLQDTSYRPDFLVDGTWIEVKGWMRPEAATKITKFESMYPSETLIVVGPDMYHAIEAEFSSRIPNWEFKADRRVQP